jgi:hypothetical protein
LHPECLICERSKPRASILFARWLPSSRPAMLYSIE